MYKKYTLDQVLTIKTTFLKNLQYIIKKEGHPPLMTYLKSKVKRGYEWYYFDRGQAKFHFLYSKKTKCFTFYDERDKIELIVDKATVSKLSALLKNPKKIAHKMKGGKKMKQLLLDKFTAGGFGSIDGRPYLVYDIETTAATRDLTKTKFYLAYACVVLEPGKATYKYIDTSNIDAFVQYMRDFDGYIIGYNSIGFDNPVIVYNCKNREQARIDQINAKSIDLFLFLRNLTNKRMGLNKVAMTLVGVEKTLGSGAEGDGLMKQYHETGEIKYLNIFKKYCKNDVEMTVLVLFYLMNRKTLYVDEEDFVYDKEIFMTLSQKVRSNERKVIQGMFDD